MIFLGSPLPDKWNEIYNYANINISGGFEREPGFPSRIKKDRDPNSPNLVVLLSTLVAQFFSRLDNFLFY